MKAPAPTLWQLVEAQSLPERDGMTSVVFVLKADGKAIGVTVTVEESPLMTTTVLDALRATMAHILKSVGVPLDSVGARLPEPGDLDPPTKLN